jgi:hypothetical protein
LTSPTQTAQALFLKYAFSFELMQYKQPTITTAINTRCTRLNQCPEKWQNSLFCRSGDLRTKLDIAWVVVGMCRVKPQGVGIPKIRDLGPSSGKSDPTFLDHSQPVGFMIMFSLCTRGTLSWTTHDRSWHIGQGWFLHLLLKKSYK